MEGRESNPRPIGRGRLWDIEVAPSIHHHLSDSLSFSLPLSLPPPLSLSPSLSLSRALSLALSHIHTPPLSLAL